MFEIEPIKMPINTMKSKEAAKADIMKNTLEITIPWSEELASGHATEEVLDYLSSLGET